MKKVFEPWEKFMGYINNRCKHSPDYNGKRRKINNHLAMEDLELMWKRDKANIMKKPSIARRNPQLDYTLTNCCFMELRENQRQPRHIYHRFKGSKLKGRWAIHFSSCIKCKTTHYKHVGKGICAYCYQRKWRKEHPNYSTEYTRKWRKQNAKTSV